MGKKDHDYPHPHLVRMPRSLKNEVNSDNIRIRVTRSNSSLVNNKCHQCDKTFIFEKNLKVHEQLHEVLNCFKNKLQLEPKFNLRLNLMVKILDVLETLINKKNTKVIRKRLEVLLARRKERYTRAKGGSLNLINCGFCSLKFQSYLTLKKHQLCFHRLNEDQCEFESPDVSDNVGKNSDLKIV